MTGFRAQPVLPATSTRLQSITSREIAMTSPTPSNEFVRIELTPTQQETVKTKTGKDAEALELSVTELEERIAPRRPFTAA